MDGIKLIIFDMDGTLADRSTANLLPGVAAWFQENHSQYNLALATNQGGVGLRYWMQRAHFGKPDEFPTVESIEAHIKTVMQQLDQAVYPDGNLTGPAHLFIKQYVSFRYENKSGKWSPLPRGKADDPRWSSNWRKPNPGMLIQAMADYGVLPENTLMVGDSKEDAQAAHHAEAHFKDADEFFKRKIL